MSSPKLYPVPVDWKEKTYVTSEEYQKLYDQSIEDPEAFWSQQAERIHWIKKWEKVKSTRFEKPVSIQWFQGAQLNVAANCVDRHAETKGDQVALIWEPDDPKEATKKITYQQLQDHVVRWAEALRKEGVKKGDRVTIYMPMIPEAVYSMLACARLGAIHSVVFAGFSPEALSDRLHDCESEYLITADQGLRAGKTIPLKEKADEACQQYPGVKKVFVIQRTGAQVPWDTERDRWYHQLMEQTTGHCEPEVMDAEDPLFILYTSGSTSKPKGVLHTSAGYLVYAATTFHYVFNYREGDIYWCAADVGWVTGHSYIVYGPLANGAQVVLFEGVPNAPTPSRIWEIIDKHQVNILYTAPTLLRSLMVYGDEPVKKTSRKSLQLLGSVGEPINQEAWEWYHDVAGEGRCPIVDTWWQTETGGILITPLPGATELKPGSATRPFFGIEPVLVDNEGHELKGEAEGQLCFRNSWPGQMRTVFNNHERFFETYFSQYPGLYFSGDGARRDADGDYWITGRVDDVLNVSGHRMGTAEIESAMDSHPQVAETAVVGYPHAIKGQGIYAYVILKEGIKPTPELEKELIHQTRKEIGPIATPDVIQFTTALPKTRSGKIMRRILRKIAANDFNNLGDTSTLADQHVVEGLVQNRKRLDTIASTK